jgi:hypothetical protein
VIDFFGEPENRSPKLPYLIFRSGINVPFATRLLFAHDVFQIFSLAGLVCH